MSLVASVRRTLQARRLIPGGAHVLVACSGGPDSTALLHVLHALAPGFGWRLTAACIDHGLRPEAGQEADLAQGHAARLGVPFLRRAVRVETTRGLQAGAREARYAALLELASGVEASVVAVGHTRDDQAETVLARLLRTPSVAGLAAIEPARADGVVRPLIDSSRAQVEQFVLQRRLDVAVDPSNANLAFTRSRVRHQWLPSLSVENPRLIQALAQLADDARQHAELVAALAPRFDLTQPDALDRLREHVGPVRRYLLRQWVREQTGTEPRFEHVDVLDRARPGVEVLLEGDRIVGWSAEGALFLRAAVKRTRGR